MVAWDLRCAMFRLPWSSQACASWDVNNVPVIRAGNGDWISRERPSSSLSRLKERKSHRDQMLHPCSVVLLTGLRETRAQQRTRVPLGGMPRESRAKNSSRPCQGIRQVGIG